MDLAVARAQPDGPVEVSILVSIFLTCFGAAATEGTATMVVHAGGRRIVGLAVAPVFIPLAPLVLVPGLLMGGVILAMIRVRLTWTFRNVRGPSRRCRVQQTFVSARQSRREWRVDWPNCGGRVTLNPRRPPTSAPA